MEQQIRRLLAGVLFCALALGVLCACGQQSAPAQAASEEQLPELRIGVDTLKPFYYTDEGGSPVGIDADIAQEACRRAGLEPVFVQISWDEKDDRLADGKVDCLWNAFSEDDREDQYTWTVPYMESRLRIIVDKGARDQTTEDLSHSLGIAVRAGSKVEELILNSTGPAIRVYSCGSFEMAKTAYIKGYASALACHEAVLQQIMDEAPDKSRFLDGTLLKAHLGVAFAKDDPAESWQALDAALQEMKTDGTIDTIIAKYFTPSSDHEGGEEACVISKDPAGATCPRSRPSGASPDGCW